MNIQDIKEDTITLAIDLQGGLCDRLMLGTKGIINNANASIECWKFNAPQDEDLKALHELKDVEDLQDALQILNTDNFSLHIVEDIEQVRELLQDAELELDLNSIEFKDNMYTIY